MKGRYKDKRMRSRDKVDRPALIPALSLSMLSLILSEGSIIHGDWDWRKGVPFSDIWDAHDRHVNEAKFGNWFDEGSGLPHIMHAVCNLIFMNELFFIKPESNNMPNYDKCREEVNAILEDARNRLKALKKKYESKEDDDGKA